MFDSHTFTADKCMECPFYDDSAGFDWCVWYHIRCDHGYKPGFCSVDKIEVEEKRNVNRAV